MYSIGFAKSKSQRGTILGMTAILSAVCVMYAALVIGMATHSRTMERKNVAQVRARYAAESAVQQGMYNIAFTNSITGIIASPITWSMGNARMTNFSSAVTALNVVVDNVNPNVPNNYRVVGTATVDSVRQVVSAIVIKNPPSNVFDYEYFLNNWGWWWGSNITGNGDQRSNGRFDFRERPTVNGNTFSHYGIFADNVEWKTGQSVNLAGLAGANPDTYLHPYVDRVDMPNLTNIANYQAMATAAHGTLTYRDVNTGGSKTISAVQSGNIYLEGTSTNPITINGPVVIANNVVLKGVITGQGTIYTGHNVYLVGDITYKNGPSSPRPSDNTVATRDAWVASNHSKDLVAFAAKGSILFGDVTNSSGWSNPWEGYLTGKDASGNVWGNDSHVGADGIPGTADDNISFDHGPGPYPAGYSEFGTWYDVNGNGVVDTGYAWGTDIAPGTGLGNTSSDWYKSGNMSGYTDWPKNADSSLKTYAQVNDTNGVRTVNGIYYTNNAFGGMTGNPGSGNIIFNGSVISKDEAIIFQNALTFNYDERVHSRYNNDPNKIINLGLPVANQITMTQWADGNMFQ
jgi:hypothetical protein